MRWSSIVMLAAVAAKSMVTTMASPANRSTADRRFMDRITEILRTPAFATLALLASLFGCASAPADERQDQELERSMERASAVLAQKTDADSLAAAGILGIQSNRKSALALLARATAAAPERPDLAWLQAQACEASPPCDPVPAETRLRALDPRNGAGWMAALSRADSSRDESAKDSALTAIAGAERVDIYWTVLVARLTNATARTNEISLPSAIDAVVGPLSAIVIPRYAPVSAACKGDRLDRAEIVEICRAVATAFDRGDAYITAMIGVGIAKRVWPEDSPKWREADHIRREFSHRYKITNQSAYDIQDVATAERYIVLLGQHRREQDALLARIVARGENPDPAEDTPN
jgi:hypothetical protein